MNAIDAIKHKYEYVGENYIEDADFADVLLREHGLSANVRTIPVIKTMAGDAVEYRYTHPSEGERYAYALTFRPDIDSWYQHILVFRQPVPDESLPLVYETISGRTGFTVS